MDLLSAFNANPHFIPKPGSSLAVAGSDYPHQHSGIAIVVGTHPCWSDDYKEAAKKYPQHDIIAVNEAVRLVKAKHLVTAHNENLQLFIDAHKEKWGCLPDHVHVSDSNTSNNDIHKHVWPASVSGGSAILAAAIAIRIGYERVILSGCPLSGGGGYPFPTHKGHIYDPRVGDIKSNHSLIKCWHNQMVQMKEDRPDIAGKIRSMSGFTKELFGGIDDN